MESINHFLSRATSYVSAAAPVTPELLAFVADYKAQTARNPFAPRMRVWNDSVGFELSVFVGRISLGFVVSLMEKGTGNASKAMMWLVSLADKHQVVMELDVSPVKQAGAKNSRSLSTPELRKFYAKFGFKKSGPELMVRNPT
jgi:hypothetical protein